MRLAEILVIAVGLAMDAFAVSIGAGAIRSRLAPRATFRLAFHFGLFQFLMPVLGWALGTTVAGWLSGVDHWIAFGLLGFVGGRMVVSGVGEADEGLSGPDPSKGAAMIMLSVATSIDALAVGLSLAMLGVGILLPAAVIGLVTGALCTLGVALGDRLGQRLGHRMELVGGLVLIGIGLKIVLDHTTGG